MLRLAGAAAILAALLLAGPLAQGGLQATATVSGPAPTTLDLHSLCVMLLRRCDDLDPAAFGMAPVVALLPEDGGWPTVGAQHDLTLEASVLGHDVAVGATADAEGSAAPGGSSPSATPQVPCADAPDCPDLLVDAEALAASAKLDTRTFDATSCAVEEGSTAAGTRTLLRFDFTSPNLGRGDLEVGRPADHPEWFTWGTCHGHWHFKEYADYRLWDLPGYAAWQLVRATHPGMPPAEALALYPELAPHMVSGHKQGFCVLDILPWTPVTTHGRQYRSCSEGQGITVDWADRYNALLDGQWVDVTGLPAGPYVLEAEVNPERLYVESDYSNNAAAALVLLR